MVENDCDYKPKKQSTKKYFKYESNMSKVIDFGLWYWLEFGGIWN